MRPILALAFISFVGYLALPPEFPFLHPDSRGYIEFAAHRTAGYPLFLMAVEKVFGDLHDAIPVQLFAMVASASYLAFEIRRITRSDLIGFATLALVITNIFIYRYAFKILTEALFFSGLAVLVGLICRFSANPSRRLIAAISLTVAICILIRPAAYVFVPILFACAAVRYANEAHRLRLALNAILPLVLILCTGAFVYFIHHGSFRTQSFIGHNLIGKTAYVPGIDVDSRYPEIVNLIDTYMKPLREVRIDNLQDRYLFRLQHYDFVRSELTTPTVLRIAAQGEEEEDNIRREVALAFIKTHFLDFADEVWLQLYSLWTVADLWTARDNKRFEQFVLSLPLDPFKDTKNPRRTSMPWLVVYGVRAFMVCIFAATICCLTYGFIAMVRKYQIPPNLMALILVSLLLHTNFLLIAALQVGYFRYLIVMWPAIISIFTLSVHGALTAWKKRRSAAKPQI